MTTFPFAQAGLFGRRGTNQARELLLSVPSGSLEFWVKRLRDHSIDGAIVDMFGSRRLAF